MPFANATAVTDALEHLTGERRQRVLEALLDRSAPVPVDELAVEIADGTAPDAVQVELVHAHLPALAEAGLVSWDRDRGAAATADHPAFGDPRFRRLLAADPEVVDCLAAERRRATLAALRNRGGRASRRALARAVAARDAGEEPSGDDVEAALVALHHGHLPKLAAAGLVEYDAETGTVTAGWEPPLVPGETDEAAAGPAGALSH